MPKRRPTIAKLSRPRLFKAVERERLLTLLDQKRAHPAVWIVAPPGAGKTTLAANYLDEAKANATWFQIDSGDSDPATFFYYLKQAIDASSKRKSKPLQLFTPEYLPDIEGFARRFFRDAFARLPEDALLVFDNYHELQPQSPLHNGFAAALAEIPVGANILILSRADPPAPFAQAVVNQTMIKISWEEIKLNPDEATHIANARGITDAETIDALQQQTDGWVAGFTLMLERSHESGENLGAARAEMLETVTEYFAQVIFEQSSGEAQDVMQRTALLPHMTPALIEAVTGSAGTMSHIRALHRRHLFISRTRGEVDTYRYHAMFHSFLRTRARASLSRSDIQAIQMKAAKAFESGNDLEGAFAMYAGSHSWEDAERLLLDRAAELISHGRWRTLREWVGNLPEGRIEANPWINYWLGRSLVSVDPAAAQRVLDSAYRKFVQTENEIGQVLSVTTVLEALHSEYDYQKFHLIDIWVERLSQLFQDEISLPTPNDELRAYTTLLNSAFYRTPDHPLIVQWIERTKNLIEGVFDPNLKVLAAFTLLNHTRVTSDESSMTVACNLATPLLASSDLTPRHAAAYLIYEGHGHYMFNRYAEALECFDRADAIAIDNGLISALQRTAYLRVLVAHRAGLNELAKQSMEQFIAFRGREQVSGPGSLEYLRALIALRDADNGTATSSALAAFNELQTEGDYMSRMVIGIVCANILIASGAAKDAVRFLELDRNKAREPNTSHHLGVIALNQAWCEKLLGNDAERDKYLREALEWAHDKRGRLRFHWFKNALKDLLPIALERGIDPQMALTLARDLNITPSDTASEQWPWPVKVYALGRFELLIDGQTPSYSRKMPKKALALLKTIIAFGGESIPEQKLIDALWIDFEGDAAHRSLSATVHRLRKLLGHTDAIRQNGGVLSLNEKLCWVDAFAFERQIAGSGDMDTLKRALQLYRGEFLNGEDGSPWFAPFREHLKMRFADAIGELGGLLEKQGRIEEAATLYARGVEADNLVESFYQGLMRCHDRLGNKTEAINVYRRLRDILSITLGIEPSFRSHQMFDALRRGSTTPIN